MNDDKYLLSSVSNTLDILDLLSKHNELGVVEISKELNIGKVGIFRMLYTLEKKEYVHKSANAKYKLGIKFEYFVSIVLENQNKFSIAKPYLEKLRDKHNESTHLSILDEDYFIIFMDKVSSNSTVQMSSKIGANLPAYFTGMGKMLLASLENEDLNKIVHSFTFEKRTEYTITNPDDLIEDLIKTKTQGYGEDLEECEIGLVCFAAPIKDRLGHTVAAISISGPSERMINNKETLIYSNKYMNFLCY
ncbi:MULTISPECIES: IclR family transcriptional regulator [Clostridium]|uniref:IclR family transcriptional regulator n=1 Tax=Clostridium TaxID=1485 RepID=UPI000825AB4A|nr:MULTISPECIES: IclR family transcriptional regulator [Clostridium]PJI06885.1 IclR family transcriptional regulator [Clostridium sp. CT7]